MVKFDSLKWDVCMYPVQDEFGLVSEFFLLIPISFAIDAVKQFEEAILSPFGPCLRINLIIVQWQNLSIRALRLSFDEISVQIVYLLYKYTRLSHSDV